jgi:predicted nucleotidyltransferase component of viral defense system
MISMAHIIKWREYANWATDEQVEQDLVLSRVLVEIFSDPFLSGELAFRGGTALHKLFFNPPARYSFCKVSSGIVNHL